MQQGQHNLHRRTQLHSSIPGIAQHKRAMGCVVYGDGLLFVGSRGSVAGVMSGFEIGRVEGWNEVGEKVVCISYYLIVTTLPSKER